MRYNTLIMYPDYRFYEDGTIISMRCKKHRKLKPTPNMNGYMLVHVVNKYGVTEYRGLHVLIAKAFHEVPSDKHIQVNHKDLDRHNNHDWNLEWVTPSQNMKHRHRTRFEKILEKY